MITVKCKKPSQMMMFYKFHQYRHIHSLWQNGWSGTLLFCSIILKSMLSHGEILIS